MKKILLISMVIFMFGTLISCDEKDIPDVAKKVEEVKEQVTEKIVEPDIFTVENTPTLAVGLVSANEETLEKFAKEYATKTIEFDATIDIVGLKDGKVSRMEMLLHSGPDDGSGTIFKIKDFGNYIEGVKPMINNGTMIAGQKIRITADVDNYEKSSGLFYLTLKSITVK